MGVNGIYGLSGSGLDVESMVKVGMLAKQNEYDKMQQKYTKNEWKKSEFLDLYGEVQTFNNSTLSQYKMSSNMNARSATSANSTIVTATANANAAPITHYVEVDKLASAAYLIGTEFKRQNEDEKVQNQLQSILFESLTRNEDGTFSIGTDTDLTFAASETAFSFSLSDGVNGTITSSNSDAVIARSTIGDVAGTHTVVVNSLASAPQAMQGGIINGLQSDSKITNFIAGAFDFTDTTSIDAMVSQYATDETQAFAFTFSDGSTNADGTQRSVKISFSFANLANTNTTVASFLENLNSQFGAAGLNIHANYNAAEDGSGGSLSITNDKVGSQNAVSISIEKKDISSQVGIPRMLKLAEALFNNEQQLPTSRTDNVGGFTVTPDPTDASNLHVTYALYGANADVTIDGQNVTFNGNTYVDTDTKMTYEVRHVTTNTAQSEVTVKNPGSMSINVTYGELYEGFTFSELTSKINGLGTNVRASYDSVQERFYFYNKYSGEKNNITFTIAENVTDENGDVKNAVGNQTAAFFNALGLKQSANGVIATEAMNFEAGTIKTQAGTDASVKVDGEEYPLDSNKTTINGVTYNFQNLTADNNKVAVTVTQDTAAIVSKVKSFVDDYNALLKKLYEWYDEKPNSDYKPLSESQKSAMKDEQIEKWEEKAKAGLLYHDKTLGNLITELRSAVSSKVEGINGKYNTIFALGISTTGLKGQLTLDESKLNAALAEDPDAVYNVFAKLDGGEKQYLVKSKTTGKTFWTTNPNQDGVESVIGSDGKPTTKTVERSTYNGIAQRLGDVFMTGMKNIKSVSGSSAEVTEDSELNNLLRELQTKMSNFKRMMAAFETQLYKKYDAMESSLALLGAQLNYVTGAFSQ